MKLQYAIPSLLGLSTTITACADPIIGDWTGESVSFDGDTIEIPYELDGVTIIGSLDMTIDADLTGSMTQDGYDGTYSIDIAVTNNSGGSYSINQTGEDADTDPLNCTLAGSELNCESDGGVGMVFKKGTK